MSANVKTSSMRPDELRAFLADERENGFASLTQAQRAFGLEFVQTGSYQEAAKAADIAPNQALRQLRDPLVSCFINYLNQRKEHYSLIDASFIETQYLQLYSKLIGEEEVPVVDREGTAQMRKVFHSSEAVAALRDMAKISGHYKDDPSLVVNLSTNLTEEQKAVLNKALDASY